MSPKHEKFDQSLRRLAAALPVETPPAALRARVLGRLPAPGPPPPKPLRLRLAAAGLAACAVAALMIAGLRSGLRPASAAEVRAAILRTNTWHFVGWHLRDGHRVRWEVWGRRSPSLYREQIGDEMYLDDGRRSTHILPPDPKNGRARGVVLILPSQIQKGLASPDTGDSGANFLVGIGGDANRFTTLGAHVDDETFEAKTEYLGYPTDIKETTTLTVDRSTHLPVRYVVRRLESRPQGRPSVGAGLDYRVLRKLREYTQAELTPTYDVPLPATVATVQSPADYVVTDTTGAPPDLGGPEGSVASAGGLTVRAEVLAQDAKGDLHLRFHAWLGNQPLSYRNTGLLLNGGARTTGRYDGTGDRVSPYIDIPSPGALGTRDGGIDWWLVPAEPFAPGAQQPSALDLAASFGVSRYERMGMSGCLIPVATQKMDFHLRLPAQRQDLEYEAAAGRSGADFWGPRPLLTLWAAEKRAEHCAAGEPGQGTGPDFERAASWWEEAARIAAHAGNVSRAEDDRRNAVGMHRMQRQSARP